MPDSKFEQETYFQLLEPNDPIYTAVGRVASAWANFEFHIEQEIWALSDIDQERGACITSQIFQVSSLFKAYIALAHLRKAEKSKITELNQMLSNQVNPIAEERNRIVHDPWLIGKNTKAIAQIRATGDRKLDYRFRPRDISIVDETHKNIVDLDARFRQTALEIRAAIHLESLEQPAPPDAIPPAP